MSDNVIARVESWLNGCRAGCPWIGPNWQDNNWCVLRSIILFCLCQLISQPGLVLVKRLLPLVC